jgi:hypothetical protein
MAVKQFVPTTQRKKVFANDLAEKPFRSLQEVNEYLKKVMDNLSDMEGLLRQYQLQFSRAEKASTPSVEFLINGDQPPKKKGSTTTINVDKIDKIVIPKIDALRKNFKIADQLSEQVEQLDALYNNVSVTFRGVRGSGDMLDKIKAMKSSAKAKMDQAMKFLSQVGEKHTPNPFKEIVQTTIDYVSPSLEFKDHKIFMSAYETANDDLAFALYLQLRDLTDEDGHQYPLFFVVFTCVLHASETRGKVEPRYYVTVMHQFATPGRFPVGKEFSTPAEATSRLGVLLDLENISTAMGTLPHNLDPDKVKRDRFAAGAQVSKIHVEPNAFVFELLKGLSATQIKDIATSLLTDLKGMLTHIKKASIKVKPGKAEDGRTTLRYTLTNVAGESQINAEDLDFLKDRFQLDDAKLRQVVKVINQD